MAAKLTKAQASVLTRLNIGAYYPAGRHISPCRALEKKGLAVGNTFGAWSITDAGRTALSQHQGGTDG